MPTSADEPKLTLTSGILSVVQYGGPAPTVLRRTEGVQDAGTLELAQRTIDLWALSHRVPGAHTMILRTPARTLVASLSNGLIIHGTSGLNLGLLLRDLRTGADIAPPTAPIPGPMTFDDGFKTTMWTIAERLASAELPRVLSFDIGGTAVELHVHRHRVQILSGVESAAAFADLVWIAARDGKQTSYSLADYRSPAGGETLSPADFLAQPTAASGWSVGADGWIQHCPPDADLGAIERSMRIARLLTSWRVEGETPLVDLRNRAGQIVCEIRPADDGSFTFSVDSSSQIQGIAA